MKQYLKPTVDVVEISVREDIAALPTAATGGTITTGNKFGDYTDITLTAYTLSEVTVSK